MLYQFWADGIDFGQQEMTDEAAKAYAEEYQLTYEPVE